MHYPALLALLKLTLVFSFDDNVLLVGRSAHVWSRRDHRLAVGTNVPVLDLCQIDVGETTCINLFQGLIIKFLVHFDEVEHIVVLKWILGLLHGGRRSFVCDLLALQKRKFEVGNLILGDIEIRNGKEIQSILIPQ